ncbi:MAG: hypothetical protein ABIW76_18485 [Fibrobacteria bacterium]
MDTTTLFGQVKDEAGLPLAGAVVTVGSASDITEADGLFLLPMIKVPEKRAVIVARKSGYYDSSRAEPVGRNGTMRELLLVLFRR